MKKISINYSFLPKNFIFILIKNNFLKNYFLFNILKTVKLIAKNIIIYKIFKKNLINRKKKIFF